MLAIVLGHSVVHGEFDDLPKTANGVFAFVITQGSRIAVDVFVMITGYFSCKKDVSFKKIQLQYIQIWTYSATITIIMIISGNLMANIKTIVNAIFPISSSQYWFATCYILLLLLSPCLKVCIEKLTQKQMEHLLLIFGLLWSIIPTLQLGTPGYSNFAWLAYVYMIGAYIRNYEPSFLKKIRKWHGIAFFLLLSVCAVSTYYLGYDIPFFRNNAMYIFTEMNKLPAIICAVLLFCGFKNCNTNNSKFVNRIAGCMFGVYLLHDNPNIRKFLWVELFHNIKYISEKDFIVRIIVSVTLVFIIGISIEWIRQYIMKKIGNRICLKQK